MEFDELTNESKLLFVIFASRRTAGFQILMSDYYESGPPEGSYSQAAARVRAFVFGCQRVSDEERRRQKDHQRKVEARIRL